MWTNYPAYRAYGNGRAPHFKRRLQVYGPAFLHATGSATLAKTIEDGDKIVVYSGLLNELHDELERLSTHGKPLILEAHNEKTGKKTHVGVLEFSGQEHNVAYLPAWMMHNLQIQDGGYLQFQARQLPTVKYLRMRPR